MKKSVSCFLAILLFIVSASGCATTGSSHAVSRFVNSEITNTETTVNCNFTEMPQKRTDLAEIFISDNTAIFAFIVAGMDVSSTELVTYDLLSDKLLGNLDLGENDISVFPTQNGEFAVFSKSEKSFCIYNSACEIISSNTIKTINEEIGFVGYNGKKLLLELPLSEKVVICDLTTNTRLDTKLPPGSYRYIGTHNNNFLIESYSEKAFSINEDGQVTELFKGASAQAVGSLYSAGIKGDYVVLFPLSGGDPVMSLQKGSGEVFCASKDVFFISHSQSSDLKDSIYLYSTDTMTVSEFCTNSQVVDAAVYRKGAIAITRENFGEVLSFHYIDFSNANFMSINSYEYNNSLINSAKPLPDPKGSTEMIRLINQVQNDYGVRIAYEEDLFDFEQVGITITFASENQALEKARLLEQLFQFLPDGLLKEIKNDKRQVVIFLCENLHPSAGGINTVLDGYNLILLSVTGNDDFFLSVAAHEMGHALEQGVDSKVLSGWRELMPEEAQNAYSNLSLTVEYTPDDKGQTPVWFIDPYGRSSEIEDRAVIFSAMFDAYLSGDYSLFSYEGIDKKADYWCQMLEESYDSCKNQALNWIR